MEELPIEKVSTSSLSQARKRNTSASSRSTKSTTSDVRSQPLPVNKVRSAVKLISGSRGTPVKNLSIDSKISQIGNMDPTDLEAQITQPDLSEDTDGQMITDESKDGTEEEPVAKEPGDDVEFSPEVKTGRKGVCFGIAEDPRKTCRRGVCQPSEERKEEKSETGEDYTMKKKICRRENLGLLTCINRPTAKDKRLPVQEIDTSRCRTLTETTMFKTSATELTAGKTFEDKERAKPVEVEDDASGTLEGVIRDDMTSDEETSDTAEQGADDGTEELAEVCECCHCAVCRCKPKYVRRVFTESDINLRQLRGLEHGREGQKLRMKYSFDTLFVPSDWDFEKEQEALRKAEIEELISRAEELERERLEYMRAIEPEGEEEEEEDEEEEGEDDSRRQRRQTEDDWATYRAMEWAGLREQYTEEAKPVKLETLDEYSHISWTSQPPPRMLLGTIGSKRAKSAATYLGPVDERKSSFVKVGSKKVQVRITKTKKEVDKAYADSRKRRQLEAEKESIIKRRREGKKGVLMDSIPQVRSIDSMEQEEDEPGETEQRAEFYDTHLPGKEEETEKRLRTKLGEIDENRVPMGLKREAQKLKMAETASIEAKKASKKKKPIPYKALTAHAAARLAALQSLEKEFKTQSCPCLPGFCTCEGDAHWTFQEPKAAKSDGGKIERTDSELEAAGIYVWKDYECPCSHSFEDLELSPEGSDDLMVARSPTSRKKIDDEYICSCTKRYEQTVLIIKPDAMIFEDVIRRALVHVGGLQIINERKIRLSPEQVSEIYSDKYYGSQSYPRFVLKMSRYPVLALCVAGLRAMDVVKTMIGPDNFIPESWFFPESIKRRIVATEDVEDAIHIADDAEESAVESRYFFPNRLVEPIPTIPSRINDFCNKYVDPTLTKGLAAVAKARPIDPVLFLAEWLLTHNPFQPWYKPQQLNLVTI